MLHHPDTLFECYIAGVLASCSSPEPESTVSSTPETVLKPCMVKQKTYQISVQGMGTSRQAVQRKRKSHAQGKRSHVCLFHTEDEGVGILDPGGQVNDGIEPSQV